MVVNLKVENDKYFCHCMEGTSCKHELQSTCHWKIQTGDVVVMYNDGVTLQPHGVHGVDNWVTLLELRP